MNNLKNINIIDHINISDVKWILNPFPHAVIDNFLPKEVFDLISKNLKNVDKFNDVKKEFLSHVEYKKKVFGDKDLIGNLKLPVDILGSKKIKKIFENFFNVTNITSLTDWSNYGGYFPFHSMKTGGLLGTHVDHSHSRDNLLHVANAIFYVSENWEYEWGGETFFSNQSGFKMEKKIYPKPNRVVLFTHSPFSFHGVKKINCPENHYRNTYYMDYYIHDNQINSLINHMQSSYGIKLKYFFHSTTFIPLVPLGIKSFDLKFLISKKTYSYIFKYLRYLFSKYFLGYKISILLKKLLS